MNTVLERVAELLRDGNVPYEHLHHHTDYTAQTAAHDTHTPGRHFAKTVVLWVDGALVLALLPASCIVKLEAFREALRASDVRLATEAEIAERFPDCEVGAIPPFGPLFNSPVYTSMALPDEELVTCTAGSLRDSVRLPYGELRRLAGAVPLAFAEKVLR